jgi:HSP20 family protein
MRKVICFIAISLLISGATFAAAQTKSSDDIDMDQLHNKIVTMKKEVDRLIKDIVSTYPPDQPGTSWSGFGQDVKVDVMNNEKEMIVKADLPGMEKDKIDITLQNNKILKIAGSREIVKKESAPGVVRQERSFGKFERVIELPAEGTPEGIIASYKDGVLEIKIPKKVPAKEEKVKILVM